MTQTPMQKAVEAAQAVINKYAVTGTFITHEALTAALASLEADGWKLMPREATKEMWIAGSDAMADGTSGGCWELMFNAAPEVE